MPSFGTLRVTALACSLATTLAACGTSGSAPTGRSLPPLPSYAAPVAVAEPAEGEDTRAVAARERAGRVQANRVIVSVSDWYSCVRARYAGERCK